MFACANANVTVVGLGATGLSLARYLGKRGASVTVVDGEAEPAGLPTLRAQLPGIVFKACDLQRDTLPDCDVVALSPGVPRSAPALQHVIVQGLPVVGDIEIFAQDVAPDARVVALTGLDAGYVRRQGGRLDVASYLREVHRDQGKIASVYEKETQYVRELANEWKSGLSSSISGVFDSIINGSFKASDALRNVVNEVARLAVQASITRPLMDALLGTSGSGGMLTGWLSRAFGAAAPTTTPSSSSCRPTCARASTARFARRLPSSSCAATSSAPHGANASCANVSGKVR